MIFEIRAVLTVEAPNETQAKNIRDELERLLQGPIGQGFLKSRGVRGISVEAPAPAGATKP
jgi:hypothetical protein